MNKFLSSLFLQVLESVLAGLSRRYSLTHVLSDLVSFYLYFFQASVILLGFSLRCLFVSSTWKLAIRTTKQSTIKFRLIDVQHLVAAWLLHLTAHVAQCCLPLHFHNQFLIWHLNISNPKRKACVRRSSTPQSTSLIVRSVNMNFKKAHVAAFKAHKVAPSA